MKKTSPKTRHARHSPTTAMPSCFIWEGEVLVLNILGQPNAKVDALGQVSGSQLNVSVTAAPRFGRATDHMLAFLAPLFAVEVGDIEVVFGRFNVNKQLRIKAPKRLPAVLARLQQD